MYPSLTLLPAVLIFFRTISKISGYKLIKIRRIIASQIETDVSKWENTKYIRCCLRNGLKDEEKNKMKRMSLKNADS